MAKQVVFYGLGSTSLRDFIMLFEEGDYEVILVDNLNLNLEGALATLEKPIYRHTDLPESVRNLPAFFPMALPHHVRAVHQSALEVGFRKFPPFIAGGVHLNSRYEIPEGVSIGYGSQIAPTATLGAFCRLSLSTIVSHDVVVGDYTFLAPGSTLAGRCHVGSGVMVGANATIAHPIFVGEGAVIGSGSVVIRDVPAGARVAGNPARILP